MRYGSSFLSAGVRWGESDLIALQRWSHEDHRPHRGHHVVGRDMFLTERQEDGERMKNRTNKGKNTLKYAFIQSYQSVMDTQMDNLIQ